MVGFSPFGYAESKGVVTTVCHDPVLSSLLGELIPLASLIEEKQPTLKSLVTNPTYGKDIPHQGFCLDLRSGMGGADVELSELGRHCKERSVPLVVVTDLERIDSLYELLPVDLCHFVIGEDPSELMLAFAVISKQPMVGAVHENRNDENSPALSKISAELAEFARALSRLAQAEENGDQRADYLADKPRSYNPPSGPVPQSFTSVSARSAEAAIDPKTVRNIINARRLRDRFFPDELFADPAWDILLDLMLARLEGTKVSVSSLCIAAAVPSTTALRWIKSMTEQGYLQRRADPTDARRVYICLSDDAAGRMARYLLARAEVSAI